MSTPNEEREIDAVSGVETTGHEWDGIKELNNPLPRWWLWIFFATIVWAVVYMVFMPAIPGIPGLRNHSERVNVVRDLEALRAERAPFMDRLANADLETIQADPELLTIALAGGESAFRNNCSTCHGVGAQGFVGYPNLNDDVWLWGGSFNDIRTTIRFGIRNDHPQSRFSAMPAYGRDGLLSNAEIADVTEYVLSLSDLSDNAEAIAAGAVVYEAQCVTCHGVDGRGDRSQGAPNLTDTEWLYGSDREAIRETIYSARNSAMPGWESRLDDATITAVAAWVHSRGGGE